MNSHIASLHVEASADAAFAFLCDPVALGRWSLGCFATTPAADGLHEGTSLYDGGKGRFRIVPIADLRQIDFHLPAFGTMTPRISARVIPGNEMGLDPHCCLVMLSAWRIATMDDARWQRLCTAHEAEIWLIKHQIESLPACA